MTTMPRKTVVLTFDDAVANHATLVAPLLLGYGFNATFYVCEFPPDFATNKRQYMTWEQIAQLDKSGFEIGNHTGHHAGVLDITPDALVEEMRIIDDRCAKYGIRKPVTFAYPGGPCNEQAMRVVAEHGFVWARGVEPRPWIPGRENPMCVPSFPVHGDDPNKFYAAVGQAEDTAIPILLFHGVPEYTHPWVNTAPERFAEYMRFLAEHDFNVIAMRDLPRTFVQNPV